jgi:DNA-binding GntR family transcriptional regulator
VESRALRDTVHEHLLAALQSGHLRPGTRVHETALAEALGTSLTPVREALFRLVEQGVLEHRPRRGFYVSEFGESEIREIYTLRARLEAFAAGLIATRVAEQRATTAAAGEMFERLHTIIAEGEAAGLAGDTLAMRDLNAKFHDELIRLAGHVLLRRMWVQLAPATWLLTPGSRLQPLTPAEVQDWVERHRCLLTVLRSGDAAAAEDEAAAHVRSTGERRLRSERNSRATLAAP